MINPKNEEGQAKAQTWLIPPVAIAYMSRAMEDALRPRPGLPGGYPPYSWREAGAAASVYGAALDRHRLLWAAGVDHTEHGVHHLAAIMANAGILLDAIACGSFIDDRPVMTEYLEPNLVAILERKHGK